MKYTLCMYIYVFQPPEYRHLIEYITHTKVMPHRGKNPPKETLQKKIFPEKSTRSRCEKKVLISDEKFERVCWIREKRIL